MEYSVNNACVHSDNLSFDLLQIHKLTLFTNFLALTVRGVMLVKLAASEEKNTKEIRAVVKIVLGWLRAPDE